MKKPFDADALHATIQRALAAAGLDNPAGPLRDLPGTLRRTLRDRAPDRHAPSSSDDPARGRHRFDHAAGSRTYLVHVPEEPFDAPRAMVVMLHGCTQSAADFAAATQMHRLADRHGFIVVYPEQTKQANASKCWNWFQPQDQRRGPANPR